MLPCRNQAIAVVCKSCHVRHKSSTKKKIEGSHQLLPSGPPRHNHAVSRFVTHPVPTWGRPFLAGVCSGTVGKRHLRAPACSITPQPPNPFVLPAAEWPHAAARLPGGSGCRAGDVTPLPNLCTGSILWRGPWRQLGSARCVYTGTGSTPPLPKPLSGWRGAG